jgi:pyruvate/2-oxoglutarate dehydrogenase complex dihydrolipoamide acyltransferase (E2) component
MPKVAVSMREGILVAWLAGDGTTVEEGQPLFTIELEKSTMDVQSPAVGVLRQVGQAGVTYKVGELIGEIADSPAVAANPALQPVTEITSSLQRILIVVPDLEAAMPQWAMSLGAGPFVCFPHVALQACEYRGRSIQPDVSMAAAFCGDTVLEMVQLHDGRDSPWGEVGIGALLPSIVVTEFDATLNAYGVQGLDCIGRGAFAFGARFAFVDARKTLGTPVQIVEQHFVLTQTLEKMRAAHRAWNRMQLTATLK